jgi:hypothetical protein
MFNFNQEKTHGFSDQCCFLSNDLEVFNEFNLTQTRNVA